MDVLTVTGLGRQLDGDYPCDIVGLVDISSDTALTVREAHSVKTLSGARGAEIVEAFLAGDMAVRMALAAVILQRAGKTVDTDRLWDARSGWAQFELAASDTPGEGDADPLTRNGGASSDTPSATLEENQSLTGSPA